MEPCLLGAGHRQPVWLYMGQLSVPGWSSVSRGQDRLRGWEGDSYAPVPHPVAVPVEKAEYIFASFLSRCYRGASVRQLTLHSPPERPQFPTSPTSLWRFYCPGSTTRSDAHPMLSSPPRTAPAVQDLVAGPVPWPSRLPTGPWG